VGGSQLAMMVMMDVAACFRDFLVRHPALAEAKRIGVAVSGGGDSVALLCLARDTWSDVTALHMNYQLRGIESRFDEGLVVDTAKKLGCQCIVNRVSPEGRGEEELRRLRYEWFQRCPVDVILTGHTCEDQAETVLFRLFRGTGLSGLIGVRPVLDSRVYRPLLGVTRGALRDLLIERKIVWREDSSNIDVAYRRNWIRRDLLPQLKSELNPQVDHVLSQLAEISLDEEAWINGIVAGQLEAMIFVEGPALVLDCVRFNAEPVAFRRRLMRGLMEKVKGNLRELTFAHVEAALELAAEQQGNGRIQVPELDLMRSFGWLRVVSLQVLRDTPARNFRVDFPVPGEVMVPENAGRLASFLDPGCNYNERGRSLDWEKVSAAVDAEKRLELRNWRPGDSYIRSGSCGPEKVKELFQKYRIPLWRRRSWPIVVLGDLLLWVAEFGPAAEFSMNPETRTALRVQWTPNRGS